MERDKAEALRLVGDVIGFVDQVRDEASAERFRVLVRTFGTPNPSYEGTGHFNLKEQTLLHIAVACGRPLAVKVLLQEGADTVAKNSANLSPLELAINFRETKNQLGPGASWATWQPTLEDYAGIVEQIEGAQKKTASGKLLKRLLSKWTS
jgi:hypothetical protein